MLGQQALFFYDRNQRNIKNIERTMPIVEKIGSFKKEDAKTPSAVEIQALLNILKIDIMSPEAIRVFPFLEKAGPGVLAGVLFGVLYGLCAGIGFSIFALLYNFFASLLGGIKFNIKE